MRNRRIGLTYCDIVAIACLSGRLSVGFARCLSVSAAPPIAAATGHEYDAVRDAYVNGEQE